MSDRQVDGHIKVIIYMNFYRQPVDVHPVN